MVTYCRVGMIIRLVSQQCLQPCGGDSVPRLDVSDMYLFTGIHLEYSRYCRQTIRLKGPLSGGYRYCRGAAQSAGSLVIPSERPDL